MCMFILIKCDDVVGGMCCQRASMVQRYVRPKYLELTPAKSNNTSEDKLY